MFRTPLTLFRPLALFRVVAIAEAVSWTLLLAGLLLRATAGLDWAVSVGGGVHGFVFLAYAVTAVLVAKNQRWGAGVTALAIVAAVVPYATVPLEIVLHRTGRLAGAWRLAPSAEHDRRDHTWHDRLFRTLIARPLLLGGGLVVLVALVFVVLLLVGPPVPKA